jgi:hypothetical protein
LPPGDITGRRENLLIGVFCLLAALRVFVFTAAFPFFNNIDESCHFDLMCKYSHGDLPQGLDLYSAEAAEMSALYASPEYCHPRLRGLDPFIAEAAGMFAPYNSPEYSYTRVPKIPAWRITPPLWSYPTELRAKLVRQSTNKWRGKENFESIQMPFYYTVVGVWYNLGKLLGLEGGNLLYWARFFNIPVYILLIWLAYVFSKELVPSSKFVYLGVPFVLTFWPQDVFYGLNNDILSAPLVTLSLYLLLRMYRIEAPRPGLALCAGLSAAAACLTKFTNAPIFAVVGSVAFLKLGPSWWRKQPLVHLVPVVLLVMASSIPIGCWLARNYVVFGDLMGSALNNRFKTWTPKPIGEYWNHPIFTPVGFLVFWTELATTIWRGETYWLGNHLAATRIDAFYALSSTVFLLAFAIAAIADRGRTRTEARLATGLCSLLFALSVSVLVLVSVSFDFGTSFYPSRDLPFLTSGRLILGSCIPFLIMYLGGFEVLLGWLRLSFARLPLLILFVDLMVVSEIAYSMQVFQSRYNWFHLP